jgi:hypothetical protein
MSSTLLKIPMNPFKAGFGHQRYTIHKQDQIYIIHPYVLSFKRKRDAIKMGRIMEGYYNLVNTWPMITFDDPLVVRNNPRMDLKYLNLIEWDFEAVSTFCQLNSFGLMDIHSIDGFRFKGTKYHWDLPIELQVDFLKSRIL